HMPEPLQIIGPFSAHQIDNVAISGDVALRTLTRAAVPFSIPAKPIPIRFGPPLDQNGRLEILRRARPGAKIDIELAADDLLQGESLFGVFLIEIGPQHQSHIRNFPEVADPGAHRYGKLP